MTKSNFPRLQVSWVEPGTLKLRNRRARRHKAAKLKKLRRSIDEFGWLWPILVDEEGVVLAGTARLAVALEGGDELVPIISVEHLTEGQKRAFILADNRLSEEASWDHEFTVAGKCPVAIGIEFFPSPNPVYPGKGGSCRLLTDEGGDVTATQHCFLEALPLDALIGEPQIRPFDHKPRQNAFEVFLDRVVSHNERFGRTDPRLIEKLAEIEQGQPCHWICADTAYAVAITAMPARHVHLM